MEVRNLLHTVRHRVTAELVRVRETERAWRARTAVVVSTVAALALVGVSMPQPTLAARRTPAGAAPVASGALIGSREPGRIGAEASAIRLVAALGGLPVAAGSRLADRPLAGLFDLAASMSTVCPAFRLRVSWEPPVGTYVIGGYLAPLGPPPTITTRQVNGVVMCQGSTYAYLGFEAAWDGIRWTVTGVPASGDDDHPRLRGDDTAPGLVPADAAAIVLPAAGDAQSVPPGAGWGPAIEPLAVYQPQATCDPLAKPGVVGFRDLVLHSFPGGRDLGIGQVCDAPDGVSEHKEGRAFDFGVRVEDPAERAMAEQLLAWLFATDQYGNQYAMIRRLGVMYIIWDRHIWGAYKPEEGWRPYEGVSPHTDHIHLSFSWPGALGQTSFWTGHVGDVSRVGSTPGAVPPHDLPPEAAAPAPPPDAPADGTAGAPAGPTPAVAAPGSNTGPASATGPPAGSPASPGSSGGSSPSSTTTTTAPPPATTPPPPPPPSAPIPTTVPTVPHFP